jgi:hypothetical protein
METIIEQIAGKLELIQFNTIDKEAELKALNLANEVLYPLKESQEIQDYTFSASIVGDILNISIFITESGCAESVQWDLTITKK